MVKSLPLFIVFNFLTLPVWSQQLTPAVISSAGMEGKAQGYGLSWTIGEPVIQTYIQTGVVLTQGFHQPNFLLDELSPEPPPELNLLVYPNPTSGVLIIECDSPKLLWAAIYDLYGRRLLSVPLRDAKTIVDLSQWVSAAYLLKVLDQDLRRVAFWRIQKIW